MAKGKCTFCGHGKIDKHGHCEKCFKLQLKPIKNGKKIML